MWRCHGEHVRSNFNRLLLSLVLAALGAGLPATAAEHRVLTQMTPHDRLYAVAFDGDYGLAVGHAGLMVESIDGGTTWKPLAAQPDRKLALHGIAVAGDRAIAVGQKGEVLVREGRGAWQKASSGSDQRLLRVAMNRDGVAVAVGAFGTLLKSTDGGKTWASIAPNWTELYQNGDVVDEFAAVRDEPTNYVVKVFDDGAILIGGEYGQLNLSTDGGSTWAAVYQGQPAVEGGTPPTIFGMNIRADGIGFASGQDGLILKTTDHGRTWASVAAGTRASLFDIDSTPSGKVIAVGMRTGLISTDDGDSWKPMDALDLSINWYSAVGHADSKSGDSLIAVGHSGRIVSLATSTR